MDEAAPIVDLWRDPGRETLGAAGAVELAGQCPGGALTGGDNHSALAQPCIGLWR